MIVVKFKNFGKPDKQYFISSENELKNICLTHKLPVDDQLKPLKTSSTKPKHDESKMDIDHASGSVKDTGNQNVQKIRSPNQEVQKM